MDKIKWALRNRTLFTSVKRSSADLWRREVLEKRKEEQKDGVCHWILEL
jgi:hypothetical protein